MIKINLTESFDNILDMIINSDVVYKTRSYFNELIRKINDNEENKYIYRGKIQDKNFILFTTLYIKYAAIKMMIK